ncbi:protein kinase domain-containing protein [Acinetobacter bouvetii]|uniref:Serine/threonine-protein kinase PK-1 n=1 Tax=Acinetobacter bouvetii TaxID=202951 RepID=A0A811GB74_9GAMM|nr:protein kinase [Acinetobacter bouvetii]CAB1214208.1 Serine/threonine-protein kinase PK-1 [Acinetobacter bouvetii]
MIQSKNPQNLLQFKAADFSDINLILKTKPRSLTFGRYLYAFAYQQQHYWLKTQALNVNATIEVGFLNEWAFYQQWIDTPKQPEFLLPFQMLSEFNIEDLEQQDATALILPHGEALWIEHAERSVHAIKQRIGQLLDAVDQLHQSGWIHGDLKREHVVAYQQQLCLIDFEQVQKIDSPTNLQNLTATPRYMAPELFHGEAKTVQTDIYALGIILYEWLSGQRLRAKNYQEWAYLHCQCLSIELPQQFSIFEKLLSGMLAKQKAQRFTDIYSIKQCLITEIA